MLTCGASILVFRGVADGVLRAAEGASKAERQDVGDALRDMEALMKRAAQMVDLADTLSSKLAKQEARAASAPGASHPDGTETAANEAASLLRSSLVKLGLPAPAVTAEEAQDELAYRYELARELGGLLVQGLLCRGKVLEAPLPEPAPGVRGKQAMDEVAQQCAAMGIAHPPEAMNDGFDRDDDDGGVADDAETDDDDGIGYSDDTGQAEEGVGTRNDSPSSLVSGATGAGRGIMPLDETWAVWNRARGIALVSPGTLRDVAPLLARVTYPPILLRIVGRPGVAVLHTPRYTTTAFAQRTAKRQLRYGKRRALVRRRRGPRSDPDFDSGTDPGPDPSPDAPSRRTWGRTAVGGEEDERAGSVPIPGSSPSDRLRRPAGTGSSRPPLLRTVQGRVQAACFAEGESVVQLASAEKVPISLVSALVEEATLSGLLLRDDGPPGEGWQPLYWPNAIWNAPSVRGGGTAQGAGLRRQ